jgi:hypothetical protein
MGQTTHDTFRCNGAMNYVSDESTHNDRMIRLALAMTSPTHGPGTFFTSAFPNPRRNETRLLPGFPSLSLRRAEGIRTPDPLTARHTMATYSPCAARPTHP